MRPASNRLILLSFISILFLLSECTEKKSTNPAECYELWAGEHLLKDVKPVNAMYWQSASWSKEYILYIELQTPVKWKTQFIAQNHLSLSSKKLELPQDSPMWFRPVKNYVLWENPNNTTSEYFEDAVTGHFFIYEQQL